MEFLPVFRHSVAPASARTRGVWAGVPRRSPPQSRGGAVASPRPKRLSLARSLRNSRLKAGEILHHEMAEFPSPNAAFGRRDSAFSTNPAEKEKISSHRCNQGRLGSRNPGIPGMGRPGREFQVWDRVGPIHGIPWISHSEAPAFAEAELRLRAGRRVGGRNFLLPGDSAAEGAWRDRL